MIRIFFLISLFAASPVLAAVNMNSVELGAGFRVERETDGVSLDGQGTFSVGASIAVKPLDLLLEFSTFGDFEDESQLSVSRRHYELMSWLRWTFFEREKVDLFLGGGLGLYWETISTTFINTSEDRSSGAEWLSGLTAGLNVKLDRHWALGSDLRLIFNTNNELSPVVDATARLKYLF